MEWTPTRIRLLREVGLCLSQGEFAKSVGFAKRTVGNAERGTHPPSLALRRALDHALEKASDAQRDRFLVTVAARGTTDTRSSSTVAPGHPVRRLGVRSAVLGTLPAVPLEVNSPVRRSAGSGTGAAMAAPVPDSPPLPDGRL